MNPLIKMDKQHKELVLTILKKNIPANTLVWVFGSRANRKPKLFSDLDLALDAGSPLPYSTLIDLKHDFDESELPYKVDLVDWHSIDKSFQEIIDNDRTYLLSKPLGPVSNDKI